MRCVIAAAQFTATADVMRNLQICSRLALRAKERGAKVGAVLGEMMV